MLIVEWIDTHDEYALMVSSDHGGQEFFGEDALRNHGEDIPGNEAIFFINTKELKEHYDELKIKQRYIHMTDENEIIAQILSNVNIPICSRGFPFKLINNDINAFISLKMKEIQLIKLMEKYIEKYNEYENNLKDILSEMIIKFSQTNYSIIKEYLTEEMNVNYNVIEEFKDIITHYEKYLYFSMKKIQKIIDKKNKNIINIFIFILIFIFIFIKIIIEIYFLLFKIFDLINSEIIKRKYYFIIITLLIIFLFFCLLFLLTKII